MIRNVLASVVVFTALISAFVVQAQSAQNWPHRPITLIVPGSPGSTPDTVARILAEGLSARLGQAVIVENRTGASGIIGLQAALRAPADGYTYVMAWPTNLIMSQFMFKQLSFDTQRDFQSVAGVVINDMAVSVGADVPVSNPRELVDWAKQQPSIMYGSYGEGSYAHLVADWLATLYQFQAVHIPHKGEQEVLLALARNDVAYTVTVLATGKSMQDTGKTRMVGVLSPQRSAFYPQLPTFKEADVDDPAFALTVWIGLFARQNVPEPIVKRMEEAVMAALQTPEIKDRIAVVSSLPWVATRQTMQETWSREIAVYENLVRSAGVEPN